MEQFCLGRLLRRDWEYDWWYNIDSNIEHLNDFEKKLTEIICKRTFGKLPISIEEYELIQSGVRYPDVEPIEPDKVSGHLARVVELWSKKENREVIDIFMLITSKRFENTIAKSNDEFGQQTVAFWNQYQTIRQKIDEVYRDENLELLESFLTRDLYHLIKTNASVLLTFNMAC